jgi:hypothetical protein
MPACRSANWPSALLAAWLLLGAANAASADFSIQAVQADFAGNELRVDAAMELALSAPAEEALHRGIPLAIVFEIALEKHRRFWWNEDCGAWTLERQVRFHALSDRYVVTGPMPDARASFATLPEALRHMGNLKEIRMSLEREVDDDGDYRVHVRAWLDIESLPSLLRPVAYASPGWRLNSGWSTWQLSR